MTDISDTLRQRKFNKTHGIKHRISSLCRPKHSVLSTETIQAEEQVLSRPTLMTKVQVSHGQSNRVSSRLNKFKKTRHYCSTYVYISKISQFCCILSAYLNYKCIKMSEAQTTKDILRQ